jgi:hypothetical protein
VTYFVTHFANLNGAAHFELLNLLCRSVPLYRHAVSRPGLWEIVPECDVLDAAVVPERDAVLLPAEAGLEHGFGAVFIETRQDVVALVAGDLVDMGCEDGVHEEALFTCDGVCANKGVGGFGVDRARVVDPCVAVAATPDALPVMGRGQAFEISFHSVRQGIIGCRHAGEEGVSADRWDGVQVQDTPHRRLFHARDVRVPMGRLPNAAGIAIGLGIGVHDDDFRMPVRARRGGMDRERAEALPERLVLVEAHFLIAKEDHLMRH